MSDYRYALLDQIEALLEQHSRAIAESQERLNAHDLLYGKAIAAIYDNELLLRDVITVLTQIRDAIKKP